VSAFTVRELSQGTKPRALRVDEMPELIESFAAAAYRAQQAGMDGVQVQSAHGYLLSQFLSPYTNRRTDEYGGSLANRMRLPLRILRAVRERVGDDFPVIVKINGTDTIPFVGVRLDEQVTVALAMQDAGADAVEVTRGHFSSFPSTTSGNFKGYVTSQVRKGAIRDASRIRRAGLMALAPIIERGLSVAFPASEGYNLPQARAFKDALSIPVLCVGGFKTPSVMQAALDDGNCDAISVARALIADPYLYRHISQPDPMAPVCSMCNKCIGVAGGLQIACYDGEVSSRRNHMLRANHDVVIESQLHRSQEPTA
jgi:2,4-dienoyl-CoA reductase-like NADH-dependent reductase (Old Yellow Enzyme family)